MDDVNWIDRTISKVKKRLTNLKGVKHVASIERKLEKVDKKLDKVKDELQDTNDTNNNDGWTELSTTLNGWSSDNKRFRGGKDYAEVTLPKKGYRSKDGVNIKYKNLDGFPTTSAELSYELYVDDDWQPVKGGKLPGLFINNGTGGKNYKKNDASYRIMWRRGGQLVGYLYPCTDQGDMSKNQGEEFMEACDDEFPPAGIDLWRRTKDKVYLKPGKWNTVRMGWTLNDPKTSNARVWLEVNGTLLSVSDARITDKPHKNQCCGIQWSLWYGGSNASWAPSRDQSFKFRNIRYKTA